MTSAPRLRIMNGCVRCVGCDSISSLLLVVVGQPGSTGPTAPQNRINQLMLWTFRHRTHVIPRHPTLSQVIPRCWLVLTKHSLLNLLATQLANLTQGKRFSKREEWLWWKFVMKKITCCSVGSRFSETQLSPSKSIISQVKWVPNDQKWIQPRIHFSNHQKSNKLSTYDSGWLTAVHSISPQNVWTANCCRGEIHRTFNIWWSMIILHTIADLGYSAKKHKKVFAGGKSSTKNIDQPDQAWPSIHRQPSWIVNF